MGKEQIQAFLTHLAVAGEVAASTQNQALHAFLFLYQDVLGTEPGWLDDFALESRKLLTLLGGEDKGFLIRLRSSGGDHEDIPPTPSIAFSRNHRLLLMRPNPRLADAEAEFDPGHSIDRRP